MDRLADWRVAAGIKPLPIWNDSSMAIIFELVVNFGLHDDAVVDATEELDRKPTIEVRGVQLPVTPPFVTTLETSGYLEFSVHPRGIGTGGPGPYPPFNPRDLGDDEIGAVGDQLYDCLRRFHGYEAAVVGWDPESLVDPAELEDQVPDGRISRLNGLVLGDRLIESWRPSGFVPFEPGYSWVPYRGTPNILSGRKRSTPPYLILTHRRRRP
jgi:hypothetical protein